MHLCLLLAMAYTFDVHCTACRWCKALALVGHAHSPEATVLLHSVDDHFLFQSSERQAELVF